MNNKHFAIFAGSDNTEGATANPTTEPAAPKTEGTTAPKTETPAPKAEGTTPEKKTLDDDSAALLKENMKKKELIAQQKAQIEELSKFKTLIEECGGTEAVSAVFKEAKERKDKALEAKGEWDKLKKQMVEEHTKASEKYVSEIAKLKEQLAKETTKISELTVGTAFANSSFLKEKTVLTPKKARIIYGAHFETSENGEVIAYDRPRGDAKRAPIVDQYGNYASFDTAIEKIINSDPERETIIKLSGTSGAGSNSSNVKGGEKSHEPKLTNLERIAKGLANLK